MDGSCDRLIFFAYLNKPIAYREKVVKANDIVWFFSSACNLRKHWIECVGRVNRTF